ncbi:MAG: hypothetical protein RJA99_1675 [Pseudomonadota bacterium]|jgi:SAM-dependent methyltransferase
MQDSFGYQQACDWINAVEERVSGGFVDYFRIHKIRYMNTFQALGHVPIEAPPRSVLDLAGAGMFTGLARQRLGAENLCFTHFEQDDRVALGDTDRLRLLPLDLSDTLHRAVRWDFDGACEEPGDGGFDLIFALEVIEHIATDPARFLREARRLLSPRGYMLLTTPNICSLGALERIIGYQNPISYPFFKKNRSSDRHNTEYTVAQLTSLIEQSGMDVIRAYTVDSWSVPSLAVLNFCRHGGISLDGRGDNIIVVCRRADRDPVEFPDGLYD